MQNIEVFITQDGSIGLYDKSLDEIFHSKFGAKTEAYEKFIEPCLMYRNKPIRILDICYGIGYNTKCALEYFSNILAPQSALSPKVEKEFTRPLIT